MGHAGHNPGDGRRLQGRAAASRDAYRLARNYGFRPSVLTAGPGFVLLRTSLYESKSSPCLGGSSFAQNGHVATSTAFLGCLMRTISSFVLQCGHLKLLSTVFMMFPHRSRVVSALVLVRRRLNGDGLVLRPLKRHSSVQKTYASSGRLRRGAAGAFKACSISRRIASGRVGRSACLRRHSSIAVTRSAWQRTPISSLVVFSRTIS